MNRVVYTNDPNTRVEEDEHIYTREGRNYKDLGTLLSVFEEYNILDKSSPTETGYYLKNNKDKRIYINNLYAY